MSTFTCEPGARLGGRYRLEDRVSTNSGWSAWMAIDETLARPVTVLTFMPGFPRVGEVVTAARAAGRITDARIAQVFDVEDGWDQSYVVMEWVAGDSLGDLLAAGPLDPAHGARIIAEAADALASAHAAGVAHLCLTPDSIRYTPGGGVKIVGLGVDAALTGAGAEDPALADTLGLGRLLYAALTGHWPGTDWPALPSAPEIEGEPLSPHQVRAGVPAALDDITGRTLFQRGRRGHEPLSTPALLADALIEVIPPPPAPSVSASYASSPVPPVAAPDQYWDTGPQYGYPSAPASRDGRRARRPVTGRVLVGVVAVLGLAAAALVVRGLGHHHAPGAGTTNPTHSASSAPPPQSTVTVLRPVSASGFDPLSSPKQDPGNENTNQAKYAIDGNPRTAWHTEYFLNNPLFGGYSYLTGAGLILTMPGQVHLRSVTVTFGPTHGADVSIKVGNSDVRAPGTLNGFTTVATATNVGGTYTFPVHSGPTGKYLLIWFTKLPREAKGPHNRYEAEIFNVVVKGSL